MRKLIVLLILSLSVNCYGVEFESPILERVGFEVVNSPIPLLRGLGATFYADYSDLSLIADYARGFDIPTFSASRDSDHPATYVDADGIVNKLETSDIGRFNHGFYDTTGFHAFSQAGVMIESASTNLLKHTIFDVGTAGLATDWSSDNGLIDGSTTTTLISEDLTNISGSQAQTITYTGVVADVNESYFFSQTTTGVVSQNDTVTVSMWIKGTSSGLSIQPGFRFFDSGFGNASDSYTSDIASSISSTEWRRFTHMFQYTGTTANANKALPEIKISGIDDGDAFSLQLAAFQFEISTFATSFIPTTTGALTRNKETLKYEIAGNRTAAVESCVVKVAPGFASSITTSNSYITDTDTASRVLYLASGNDIAVIRPNEEDNSDCRIVNLIDEAWTANAEMTLGYTVESGGSPIIAGYFDGVIDGTPQTVEDFTANVWGTYFWVGNANNESNQFNGTIQSIAFFSRTLSAEEQLQLHRLEW